jgi:hypothetical protein
MGTLDPLVFLPANGLNSSSSSSSTTTTDVNNKNPQKKKRRRSEISDDFIQTLGTGKIYLNSKKFFF